MSEQSREQQASTPDQTLEIAGLGLLEAYTTSGSGVDFSLDTTADTEQPARALLLTTSSGSEVYVAEGLFLHPVVRRDDGSRRTERATRLTSLEVEIGKPCTGAFYTGEKTEPKGFATKDPITKAVVLVRTRELANPTEGPAAERVKAKWKKHDSRLKEAKDRKAFVQEMGAFATALGGAINEMAE